MFQSWVTQLGAAMVLIVCLYALIKGGGRERFGAVIYLAAYALIVTFGLISTEYTTLYLLVVDVLCIQGFVVVSWKSPHPWPKWALAGQGVSVAADVAHLLNWGLDERAYLTLATAAGWGVLLAILLGTIAAAQARRDARHVT